MIEYLVQIRQHIKQKVIKSSTLDSIQLLILNYCKKTGSTTVSNKMTGLYQTKTQHSFKILIIQLKT